MFIISPVAYGQQQRPVKENQDLVNEAIRFPEVLVIDQNGNSLGVKTRREALAIAEEANLDLLCVAPMAKPAVCKILNYGKFRYEQQKKAKEAKKNQHIIETHEIRFTPQTDKHDLETKAKATREWLKKGDKVKIAVRFRGRQMAHPEIGEDTLNTFIEMISEFATVDKKPNMEGNRMYCSIVPKKVK